MLIQNFTRMDHWLTDIPESNLIDHAIKNPTPKFNSDITFITSSYRKRVFYNQINFPSLFSFFLNQMFFYTIYPFQSLKKRENHTVYTARGVYQNTRTLFLIFGLHSPLLIRLKRYL